MTLFSSLTSFAPHITDNSFSDYILSFVRMFAHPGACMCAYVCVCVCTFAWASCVHVCPTQNMGNCVNTAAIWLWRHKGGLVAIRLKNKQVTKREMSYLLEPLSSHTHTHTHSWSWSDVRPATGWESLGKHSLAKQELPPVGKATASRKP